MPEVISDLFNVQSRYLRSTHLERDFLDASAVEGYVITPQIQKAFVQMSRGLHSSSGQRAWRITGDFGTGKSSFALALAQLFSKNRTKLSLPLQNVVDFREIDVPEPNLLPILVTGTREPLSSAILRALLREIQVLSRRGRQPIVADKIQDAIFSSQQRYITGDHLISLLTETGEYLVKSQKAGGILIVLDELGKFLEFGALNPDQQDLFLLQQLAESAARSQTCPLYIVGILHQGINAYSEHLSDAAQKELEKIAGRFEELTFHQPIEQAAILVANALMINLKSLPTKIKSQAERDMLAVAKDGWYGISAPIRSLSKDASRLYPIHPSALPVIIKFFNRFGQNERSLFSFLLSNEPFGLQHFAVRSVSDYDFYRIHNFYDYVRTTFGYRLSLQSYRSHWNHIDSLILSFIDGDPIELETLKTVGMLNLLDIDNLTASEDAVAIAVSGAEPQSRKKVVQALDKLQKGKRGLYYRGIARGYSLWNHANVNLEQAYDEATRVVGSEATKVSAFVSARYLKTRPLVARRHYIETGNLRHFEVRYCAVSELKDNVVSNLEESDGLVLVALCETEDDRRRALSFANSESLRDKPEILFAVPKPLNSLIQLVKEHQKWEWIAANTPELNHDRYALEEVSRQVTFTRQIMENRVHAYIGLQRSEHKTEIQWFRQASMLPISSSRELLEQLSSVCDEIYFDAPRVHNELINRRSLSSAAAAARMRLIERIFANSAEPLLAMDSNKRPPEMSIYFSVLKNAGLHVEKDDGNFSMMFPESDNDSCHIGPSLERIGTFLQEHGEKRVKVSEIIGCLRRPPYGVRDGLSPLLFAIYAVINQSHLAFYKDGIFVSEMAGLNIMHMIKVPAAFEVQYCKIEGIRVDLYEKLVDLLALKSNKAGTIDILDVVRSLCVFAAKLPVYTHKTKKLSRSAINVRDVLLSGREPATLLFRDLPKACGLDPFSSYEYDDKNRVTTFVESLKGNLEELRMAYLNLQNRMRSALVRAFDLPENDSLYRTTLKERAEQILIVVKEPKLRTFCLRLIDSNLAEPAWVESLASFLSSMPPAKWAGSEEDIFEQELNALVSRFRRVESIEFRNKEKNNTESAMRVSITQANGREVENVIYYSAKDKEKVLNLEREILSLLKEDKRLGQAAAANVFWTLLSEQGSES